MNWQAATGKLGWVLLGAVGASLGWGTVDAARRATAAPKVAVGYEGTMVLQPEGGPDMRMVYLVEPGVASMVFADEAFARELVAEARSMGERLCLSDLGPQKPEHRGQRWWVFSC